MTGNNIQDAEYERCPECDMVLKETPYSKYCPDEW